ncbi:MAG: CPBP family intramembrane metalloprotease [Oscillospiraceae bacterium]|nr:CPBP family intramembrane metalloprotease [Oscillospiraceae bacterium]
MPSGSDERISSLRQQDSTYNEMFRKWSLDKENHFGFYKRSGETENTYQAGEGFVGQYPAADEADVLHRTARLTAFVLCIYSAMQLGILIAFSGYPTPIMGMYICKEGFFIGHGYLPVVMTYAVNILTRLIPIAYLIAKLKAPLRLMLPLKITNKPLFRNSIFFAMIAFGVFFLILDCEKFLLGRGHDWEHIKLVDDSQRVPILILYTLIIPVISEIINRGIFLNLFRQYGDGFALLITSILSSFFSPEGHILFVFCYSLLIGFFALRTGSVITSVIMRIVISSSYYSVTMARVLMDDVFPKGAMAVITIFIGVGVVATIRFVSKYSNKIGMPMNNMFLSDTEKILMIFTSPVMIIWLMIYIVYIVMSRFIML